MWLWSYGVTPHTYMLTCLTGPSTPVPSLGTNCRFSWCLLSKSLSVGRPSAVAAAAADEHDVDRPRHRSHARPRRIANVADGVIDNHAAPPLAATLLPTLHMAAAAAAAAAVRPATHLSTAPGTTLHVYAARPVAIIPLSDDVAPAGARFAVNTIRPPARPTTAAAARCLGYA